jgi:hypothetical protein
MRQYTLCKWSALDDQANCTRGPQVPSLRLQCMIIEYP